MELGDILREQRTIKKLSLRDLSALSNVSISQLSKIERGSHIPSSKTISKITSALKIDEEEFLLKRSHIAIYKKDEKNFNYLRYKVLLRDSFTCQLCGAKSPSTPIEIDLITPMEYGGINEMDNMITLCTECLSGRKEDLQVNGLEKDFLHSKFRSKI